MRFVRSALVLAVVSGTAGAQSVKPTPIQPDSIAWKAVSHTPGAFAKTIIGDGQDTGMYVVGVRFVKGTRAAPHTHPDDRFTLVISGTLYVGFGEVFDESALVAIPQGSLYVAPAKKAHFLWARDGDVVLQESGLKPTATTFVKPAGGS